MAKVPYIEKDFRKSSLDRLTMVNEILNEYAADGYDLSLRQLYYQLVARDYIENTQRAYYFRLAARDPLFKTFLAMRQSLQRLNTIALMTMI